ncbi:N-acetylglucosamine kinase [Microbacterium sp.]|uniref:N-acetylglucosamine kinase n=1 Tax=Microbacterium sp. TaxID=51671 RepID=UPI003F6EAC61
MTPRSVLAIDAGQTGMKVRLQMPDGHDDLVFRGIDTHDALLPQLAEVVRASLARTHATPEILSAGISGLTARDADASELLSLVHGTGLRGVTLAHDSTTSFLGALGDRHGSVVAAGTGVVTLAVGPDAIARVDGWGYIMGDAGSGYWIGREALDAVMRAYDGRGAATGLTDVVRSLWPDLAQAYMDLQSDENRVRIVAGFATEVARLAVEDDAVALDITRRAAGELAASVSTSISRVRGEDEVFAVCAIGGVFRSPRLREAFADAVTLGGERSDVEIVTPQGAGIDGVVALADLPSAHPLTAAIHRAGTA